MAARSRFTSTYVVFAGGIALSAGSAVAQLSDTSFWPKFQRDAQNTGFAPVFGFATDMHVVWATRLSDPISTENHASPVLSPDNSRLFVGGRGSRLTAVRAADGSIAWSVQLGDGTGQIFQTAAVGADGSIYVGSWDNAAPYDGFAKVRDNGDSGAVVWSFPMRRTLASPTITPAGLIIVGGLHATDGSAYYALRDLGDTYDIAWSAARLADPADPASTGNIGAAAALSPDGAVVYGGSDQNRRFWKLDAGSGAELARIPLTQYVWAAAALVTPGGYALIGEGMNFTNPNPATEGKLYAFRPDAVADAGILESLPLNSGHLNGGIAALRANEDGFLRLYVAANGQGQTNARIIAVRFDPDGPAATPPRPALTNLWFANVGVAALAYPATAVTSDAVIYMLGPADHLLYAIRDAGNSGRTLWTLALASFSRVSGWQVANQRGPRGVTLGPDATIYWNAPDGYLYALRGWPTGDLDGDGATTVADIPWLEMLVEQPVEYALRFPEIDGAAIGDIDGSGSVSAGDVTRLRQLLGLP